MNILIKSIIILLILSPLKSYDFDTDTVKTKELTYAVELFSDGYVIPWGMAFMPNRQMLVADLSGKLYLVNKDGKRKSEISGVPEVYFKRQGGLMDVEIDPNFSQNRLIYISYSHLIGKKSFTRVARAELANNSLKNLQVIYKADEKHYTKRAIHFGSRIIFDNKYMYFSIGDSYERKEAQDINTPNGKIHRTFHDGTIPNDNPFNDDNGNKSSIWCYGNRNPQGLAITKDGTIWELEHGPMGGDELNIIRKGVNYGWPTITYGRNYSGTKISNYTEMEGMEQPIWHWTPSIAVCGMKVYENKLFEPWQDNILVTSLKDEYLERVIVKNGKYVDRESVYKPGDRVRDVEVGPSGKIYVALEDPGRIVVLSPIPKN